MKTTRQMGSLQAAVFHDDSLTAEAQGLLKKLAELHAKGPALRDGTTIDFGWSRLTLLQRGDELVVHEPDFDGNPFAGGVPDVSRTLGVLRAQLALTAAVGVEPYATRFDQKVALVRGGLELPRIYLERRATSNAEDSGWFIGDAAGAPPRRATAETIDVLWVFQLLRRRRAVMQVLALPAPFLVVFDGENIEAIVDGAGKNVWPEARRTVREEPL